MNEPCWGRYFTCSPENTVQTSKSTPVTFFFSIAGGISVFFTFFVLVRHGIKKRKYRFRKNHIFRNFQNNPLKVILHFSISSLFSNNIEKNHLFWLFSWSLPVCCLPEMFITESVMTRDVKIKVGWFSSEDR